MWQVDDAIVHPVSLISDNKQNKHGGGKNKQTNIFCIWKLEKQRVFGVHLI